MKSKEIHFRVTEREYSTIREKANKSNMNLTDFLIASANNCEIRIYNDLIETQTQLRYIGNNLNQLTKLCHEGRIECLDLSSVKEEVGRIWQSLNSLIKDQN